MRTILLTVPRKLSRYPHVLPAEQKFVFAHSTFPSPPSFKDSSNFSVRFSGFGGCKGRGMERVGVRRERGRCLRGWWWGNVRLIRLRKEERHFFLRRSNMQHKLDRLQRATHTIYYHALITLYLLFPPQKMPLPTCPWMQFFHCSALKTHFTCHLHRDAFFFMLSGGSALPHPTGAFSNPCYNNPVTLLCVLHWAEISWESCDSSGDNG